MARLARLRFAGLGHENARLDDLVVAFTDGAGHAVVADACGDILWSASIRDGGPQNPTKSRLIELAH